MNRQKFLFISLFALSLFFHIVFFFVSTTVWIRLDTGIEKEVRNAFRMKEITFLREVKAKTVYQLKKLQFPDMKSDILKEASRIFFDEPALPERAEQAGPGFPDMRPEKDLSAETAGDMPAVLRSLDRAAEEKITVDKKRSFLPSDRDISSHIKKEVKNVRAASAERIKGEEASIRDRLDADIFSEELPRMSEARVLSPESRPEDTSRGEEQILEKAALSSDIISHMENLDDYVDLQIAHQYIEEDRAGYFRLTLSLKEGVSVLQPFSKNVIFVLDISRSMEDDQVRKTVDSLTKIVNEELFQDDRFNIVLFSQKNRAFSDSLVLRRGWKDAGGLLLFLKDIVARGQTDVFGSLSPIMTRWGDEQGRAGILVLISDGRSTRGVKDPTEVIRKVTRLNRDRWRIYCFGTRRADRYFLDMLSFMNKGYSFYSENFVRIDRDLLLLFEEIKEPVVINVSFQRSGEGIDSVCPTVIPDLFRKGKIVFYGKYRGSKSVFSGRIYGDTSEGPKEIVFRADFSSIPEEKGLSLKEMWKRAGDFENKKPRI